MFHEIYTNLFHSDLYVLEKIIRPVFVYFFLIVGLRLAGKRELAQLNTFDLVVLLTLSNTVQNAIIGNDNSFLGGVIGASTLLAVNFLVVRFLYSHERLDRWVEGEPDVLIDGGKVQLDRLKKELITLAELQAAAHKQGFADLADVERAVLEPGGAISFIAHKPDHDEIRHRELMHKIAELDGKLAALAARS